MLSADHAQVVVVKITFAAAPPAFDPDSYPPPAAAPSVDLYFSDAEWSDSSAGIVARPLLIELPSIDWAITSRGLYSGSAETSAAQITVGARQEMRDLVAGLSCKGQDVEIRKGPVSYPWSALDPDDALTVTHQLRAASRHEDDGERWTIPISASSEAFKIPLQQRLWEGRGRIPDFDRDLAGAIVFPHPGGGVWDALAAASYEIGFEVDDPVGDGVVQGLAQQQNLWALGVVGAGESIRVRVTWHNGVGFSQFDSTTDLPIGTRHHCAIVWDGSTKVTLYVNGEEDDSRTGIGYATSNAPQADDIRLGRQFAAYLDGKIDLFRAWSTARSHGEIAANLDRPATAAGQAGLLAECLFEEGIGVYTVERVTRTIGSLPSAATWYATGTGMSWQRGQPKPVCIGVNRVVKPVLIDPIERIYAVNWRNVQKIAPAVGGRSLAKFYSTSGSVVFDAAEGSIRATSGSIWDPSEFVAFQIVAVAGTASNDGEFQLLADPEVIDGEWFVPVSPAPVDEGPVVATTVTVSGFSTPVSASSTGDFVASNSSFIATDGADLSAFRAGQEVAVDAPGSANDGELLVLRRDPSLDSSGFWVLWFSAPVVGEVSTAATFDADADAEYVDLGNGQFRLLFEPQKPVTAYVEGDLSGAAYVDTAPEVAARILDSLGDASTQALSALTGTDFLTGVAEERPYVCGYYHDGTTDKTLYDALGEVLSPVGLAWTPQISSREITLTSIPPPAGSGAAYELGKLERATSWRSTPRSSAVKRVRIYYARNHLPHGEDDLDFFVAVQPGGFAEARRNLYAEEWRSVVYPPESVATSQTEELSLFAPVQYEGDAADLAAKIYGVVGGESRVIEAASGRWLQTLGVHDALTLIDPEDGELESGVVGYVVRRRDGVFSSSASVLIL